MEDTPVTSLLGAMGPLLGQLHSFMATENSLPQGFSKDEIASLRRDLEGIFSSAMDLSEAEDPSFTAKCWTKEVREISYDVEDYFDVVVHFGAAVRKICCIQIPKLKRRPQIAEDISELRVRLQDVSERRKRFQLVGAKPVVSLRPQLQTQRAAPAAAGLIDGPMNKLVKFLDFDGEEQLKVVPIFGFAGVGKTTVARSLYRKFGGKFDCRAFLRVSRNPDMRRLLTSMLSQIKGRQPHGFFDVHNLADNINKHLLGKRYLIVIDDLWATSTWDIISRAFPEGNCRSRIITTTQIEDVALACCSYHPEYIFNMEPLNDDESRQLFFSIFGSKDNIPQEFVEVSYEIIRKCGGFPLATVNIASLLASEPNFVMEKWRHIQNSLCSTLGKNPTAEGTKEVLNLIYNNLPPHLKTCLLYLNMYPEDCEIRKDDLVKQWIAEGFLNTVKGQDTEEVAGSYFDELVNRRMIQPVDTNYDDEVLSCTVHHMVLDLITNKSIEENFNTSVDYYQTTLEFPDKVRRLSVKFGGAEGAKIPGSIKKLSQTRSLTFFGLFKCVPSIVEYRLLRVLILHIWADQHKTSLNLARIRELFQLRYLKIECNMTVKLPAKIRGLQCLTTLDVDARVAAVPLDIAHLQRLLHLSLPSNNHLPHGIGHMTSLLSLGYFNLSNNSSSSVRNLRNLTSLRDLHLTCSTLNTENLQESLQCLGLILSELSNLKSLTLVPDSSRGSNLEAGAWRVSISCDGLSSVPSPPAHLQRLELLPRTCIFSSLPKWIGELNKLCILKIEVMKLGSDDIDILKGLSALTILSLYVRHSREGRRIIVEKEGFPVLKYFKFVCTAPCLEFREGAMLNVRRLKLGFAANGMEQYIPIFGGIEHLTGLEEVSAKIWNASSDKSDNSAAKGAWESAIRKHPSTPMVNVKWVGSISNGDKQESTATQKETQLTLEHGIQEKGSEEDATKQADSRSSPLSESSSHMQNPGEDKKTSTHEEKHQTLEGQQDVIVEEDSNKQGIPEKDSGEDTSKQADSRISEAWEVPLHPPNLDKSKATQDEECQSPEKHRIHEKNKEKDTKKRADNRTSALSDSSRYMWKLGGKRRRPMGTVRLTAGEIVRGILYAIKEDLKLKGGVKNDINLIKREMELMTIIIEESKENNQGALPEKWILQMQESVYDIEDFINIYNQLHISRDLHMRRALHNMSRALPRIILVPLPARVLAIDAQFLVRRLAHLSHMEHLKGRVKGLREWQESAKTSQSGFSTATPGPSAGSRRSYYALESEPVGIYGPKKKLLRLLHQEAHEQEQLRVISIVGCTGLGKTTLAGAVCRDPVVADVFDARAWVVASECNGGADLLNKILEQLRPRAEGHTASVYGLTENLQEVLRSNRCLVVIDGVQRAELWYDIERAFPKNGTRSKIIVTTSIQSVAAAASSCSPGSHLYRMRGLSDHESKKLFWLKVGSRTNRSPALDYALGDIFHICDGLPLALISAANCLLYKESNLTRTIEKFGNYPAAAQGAFEEMNRALVQCYDSLPDNGHKTCLLSLSIFPQGSCIKRKSLIRRWIAEGLVVGNGTLNKEQVAGGRFDELIDRNIIEPVMIGNNSKVKRCRVHGAMLEFIVNKSVSKNFVTLIRKDEPLPNQKGAHPVRRLSVHDGTAESGRVAAEIGLSAIRLLAIFNSEILDFQSCKLLRVLDLEGCKGVDERILDGICNLLFLRYLSLRGSDVRRIPKRIRKLCYLETLDIRETEVEVLPMEAMMLPRLAHLFGLFDLPRELEHGKRNSALQTFFSEESILQTLSGFFIDRDNRGFEHILLHMRSLRKVKIRCKSYATTDSKNLLVSSLQERFTGNNALESLSIDFGDWPIDFLNSLEPPCMLSSIKLRGKLVGLPSFITLLHTTLSELQLSSTGLSSQDLSSLQSLRNLLYLKLVEDYDGFWGGGFVVKSVGFPSLRRLCIVAPELPRVCIEIGGMRSLTSLHLLCPGFADAHGVEGLEHLEYLNEVVLHSSVGDEKLNDWEYKARHLKNRPKVSRHPIA